MPCRVSATKNYRRRAPGSQNQRDADKIIITCFIYVFANYGRAKISLMVNGHSIMMHDIAEVTFFLNSVCRPRLLFSALERREGVFYNIMLVHTYHVLPRRKANQ